MSDFKIVDKRRSEDELKTHVAIPASLNADEVTEVLITKDKLFVHPTPGRILVQGDAAAGKIGRIIMPQKVQRAPTTGIILEVGEGVVGYHEGQKIAYGLYSGTVLTFKGWDPKTRINFRILNQDEILATVDKDSPELEGVGI